MSESIYAPPEADVATSLSDEARYYVVAPVKFMLLSILSFTLYFVYWFYRNWKLMKAADNEDTWPVARGFFYIFFTHSLFTDVNTNIESQDKSYDWSPSTIATVFVAFTVLGNLADRFIPYETVGIWVSLLPFVMAVFLSVVLLQAQKAVNFACDDVEGRSNASLTAANWVWMLLGGLVWLVIFIGYYAVLTDPSLS